MPASENGTAPKFDPEKHLTNLNPNGAARMYLETKWRLVWLRSEHPNAHIETTIYQYDGQVAIVRARITLPDTGAFATGIGTAEKASSSKFSGRILEKAETAALGRACGALGYGTQFSAGEFEDAGNLADTPRKPRQQGAPSTAPPDEEATARAAFWAAQTKRKLTKRETVYKYLAIPNDVEHPLTAYWLEPCDQAGMTRVEAYRLADSLIGRVLAEALTAKKSGDPDPLLTALSVIDPQSYIQRTEPAATPA